MGWRGEEVRERVHGEGGVIPRVPPEVFPVYFGDITRGIPLVILLGYPLGGNVRIPKVYPRDASRIFPVYPQDTRRISSVHSPFHSSMLQSLFWLFRRIIVSNVSLGVFGSLSWRRPSALSGSGAAPSFPPPCVPKKRIYRRCSPFLEEDLGTPKTDIH